MSEYKVQVAELFIRSFTAILFLLQGYDKIFRIKMPGVIETFRADATRYHVPSPVLNLVAYYTSYVELLGGLCLLVGFCSTLALYALGLDLLIVAFAFSVMEPMWDLKHVFPRVILLAVLLMLPADCSFFSLDHLIQTLNNK
jgi:putative oxidoreductase